MKKLIKFVKYNPLIILPFGFFLLLIIIGAVMEIKPVTITGVGFMTLLIVSLFSALRNYE